MKAFASEKALFPEEAIYFDDVVSFEAAHNAGEIEDGSEIVIGVEPGAAIFHDCYFSFEGVPHHYFPHDTLVKQAMETAARLELILSEANPGAFARDAACGISAKDWTGYNSEIEEYILESGGNPEITVQFYNLDSYEKARDAGDIEPGSDVMIGDTPETAVVFPYISD